MSRARLLLQSREGATWLTSRPGSPDALSRGEWEAALLFSCQRSLEKPALQPLPLISSKADTLADKRQLLSVAAGSEHFLARSIDFSEKTNFPTKSSEVSCQAWHLGSAFSLGVCGGRG